MLQILVISRDLSYINYIERGNFFDKYKQNHTKCTMKILKKRGKKKLYRKFQMELSQTAREEIDRIIKDHIMVTDIWDNKHFCNAYWNITLHLQPWEE